MVVFLPGFMQRGESWGAIARNLGRRYPSFLLDFSSFTYEERLAEVEQAAPGGSVLVGYSMGGRLGLHAALRHPDRYGGLVTVGVSAGIEDPAARATRRLADDRLADWMERSSIEEIVARWEQLPVFAGQPHELVDAQRTGRLAHEPADLARLLRSAGQGVLDPVWGELPELRVPVLILAGELDTVYADAALRMAEVMPRATAHLVPGAGHAAHLESPGGLSAALLPFLDQHLGQG